MSARTDFLCSLDANTYGIAFLAFAIRDGESKRVLFQVGEDMYATDDGKEPDAELETGLPFDVPDPVLDGPDALRSIRYDFNVDVLRLPVISTQ